MKRLFNLLFFLRLLAITGISGMFFLSCKKDDKEVEVTTVAQGYLLTGGLEDPVPNGPHKIRYSVAGHGYNYVDETHTDERGYFRFNHTEQFFESRETGSIYYERRGQNVSGMMAKVEYIGPNLPGYSDIGNGLMEIGGIRRGHFQIGFKGSIDLLLYRMAWVRIHIVNENPDPQDRIRVQWGSTVAMNYEGAVDTELIYLGSGLVPNQLRYWVTKANENSVFYEKHVTLGDNDTTYHKIAF